MKTRTLGLLALGSVVLAAASLHAQPPASFDLIIRNGRVLDGSGNPWFYADVAVTSDHIAAVGDLGAATANRVIDAKGLYVAPGFIDVHSHAGEGLATAALAHGQPLLAQGITTIFANPDGGGPVDLAKQHASLQQHPLGVNVALMIPHGSVRRAVLGMSDRDPTPAELDRMRTLVQAGMESGAFGLSDGPYYAPASYSKTEEIIELAKVAARFGGAYSSHIRDEADYTIGLVAAVDEVIRVSREAGLPGVVGHIKALGPRVWGLSTHIVERINQARAQGVQVYADQYPYEASGTGIVGALVPRWALVGGDSALRRRMDDPAENARLRRDLLENLDRRGGADRLQFSSYAPDHSVEGKTLGDIARARGAPPAQVALDMLRKADAGIVSFNMAEADIRTFMRQPWTMTCTDGGLVSMTEGVPHPRFYGSFPRKIRKYVTEEHAVDLPAAIRSMTSLAANVFHLDDRGALRTGMKADIVVFDLPRVRDAATYVKPHQLAEGMVYVVVNGGLAMDSAKFVPGGFGRVLSRHAPAP